MLINTQCSAAVNGAVRTLNVDKDDDSDTGNDYVIDCRRRRSPDGASVDGHRSEDLNVGREPSSPMSATATYWHDVIGNDGDKMVAGRRRCDSCKSDVSVTSLPESLASDSDVVDSPPCKEQLGDVAPTPTGSSFAAVRQPEREMESATTSGHVDWSRDVVVRPQPPTAVGFSIADILRPDFGRIPYPAERKDADRRRTSPYPSSMSLLPSTLRRSLVHPYTAAAAFCAAAVAAAGAGIQVASARGCTQTGLTQRPELLRQPTTNTSGASRRVTSSRDVTYHAVNNNNNNAKLRSRYVYDDKDSSVNDLRQKTSAGARRTRVERASPSILRATGSIATANPATISRPDQSVLASPTSQTSSSTSTNGPSAREGVVDGKHGSEDGATPALVPLPWPAWVYCTRYSDRPSSGRQSKSSTPIHAHTLHTEQERQRVAVVYPGTRISFLFARCRHTRPRYAAAAVAAATVG